ATLTRSHAGHDVRPVRAVAQAVEASLGAGEPLYYEARVGIDENRHQAASSTARRAPSSIVASVDRLGSAASARMLRPSSAFVPSRRTTMGSSSPISPTACRMPR